MSSRIIASSSSNRYSASARASSVFPTPVGPRKMKLPIGRFGSFSPARARRSASATASIALSWPITRSCSASSMCSSFSASPSIIRLHRDARDRRDQLGDVRSVTVMSAVCVFSHSAFAASYSSCSVSTSCLMRAAAS